MEPQDAEAMLVALFVLTEEQRGLNARVATAIERLDVTTARLEASIARIDRTLAAMTNLLGRGNGR
jgi:hypothetical protein